MSKVFFTSKTDFSYVHILYSLSEDIKIRGGMSHEAIFKVAMDMRIIAYLVTRYKSPLRCSQEKQSN